MVGLLPDDTKNKLPTPTLKGHHVHLEIYYSDFDCYVFVSYVIIEKSSFVLYLCL